MNTKTRNSQSGAALAISLILLVAMTILGVATLNGTRLAERVSSNAQQKAIVFETAESTLNSLTSHEEIDKKLFASITTRFDPDPVPQVDESTADSNELDQTSTYGTSVDVTSDATIQFCGEKVQLGGEYNGDESQAGRRIGYEFDIRALANITNSKAAADHVTRIAIDGPVLDSTGDCVAPGL